MQHPAQLSYHTFGFRPILWQKSVLKKRIGCRLRRCANLTVPTLYSNVQPFPQKKIEVLWPLLTSAALCISIRAYLRLRLSQISPGKNADLHPMYLPHLPPKIPGSGRALFCFANSPTLNGLLCGFCSSGQDFAASFLQIPTHDGHPCYWLILLAAKRIADLHRRVCAHAGRTNTSAAPKLIGAALNVACRLKFMSLEIHFKPSCRLK